MIRLEPFLPRAERSKQVFLSLFAQSRELRESREFGIAFVRQRGCRARTRERGDCKVRPFNRPNFDLRSLPRGAFKSETRVSYSTAVRCSATRVKCTAIDILALLMILTSENSRLEDEDDDDI